MAQADDSDERKTLWVGGIHQNVNESILYELFQNAGPLMSVRLPVDKDTKRQKNFAFIKYHHEESVPYAIELFRDTKLYGQSLRLQNRAIGAGMPQNQNRQPQQQQQYQQQQYQPPQPPAWPQNSSNQHFNYNPWDNNSQQNFQNRQGFQAPRDQQPFVNSNMRNRLGPQLSDPGVFNQHHRDHEQRRGRDEHPRHHQDQDYRGRDSDQQQHNRSHSDSRSRSYGRNNEDNRDRSYDRRRRN